MKNKIILIVSLVVALFLIDYIMLLPLNIRYINMYVIFVLVVSVILVFRSAKGTKFSEVLNNNREVINRQGDKFKKNMRIISLLVVSIVLIQVFSSPIFFAKKYSKLIGEVESHEFSSDFKNVEIDDLPIVDSEYAKVLGDKKLGSDSGLGSEFHVGNYTDIEYKGTFYSVAPLEYNGLIKWFSNRKTGAPGYILIEKSTGKVELISEINGEKIGLKYIDSAYFNADLTRTAYFNGGYNNRMIKQFFELDDKGNPYFIIPKVKKMIGITGGEDVYEVVVVDAQSGETKVYDVGSQPKWIDNVYPAELIDQQLSYYGLYQDGFLNSIFSQKDVIKPTEGQRHYYNDGLFTYTGLTSIGVDESTVGIMTTNVTSKYNVFYQVTGATEIAAMKSAEGKVQDLGYSASFPIPVNVNGEAAYFITLKDAEGLIKQYAFVNVDDYSIVEIDNTISGSYEKYTEEMGYNIINSDDIDFIEGKVVRVSHEVVKGNSKYVLFVEVDGQNYLYTVKGDFPELVVTNESDLIKFKVVKDVIVEFDNLNIDNKK